MLVRNPAHFEDSGLLGFDQKQYFLLDLGGGGDPYHDLVDPVEHLGVDDFQLHVDLWRFLLEEDGRRVRQFERRVLQIDALQLEYGCLRTGVGAGIDVGHGVPEKAAAASRETRGTRSFGVI